MRKVKTRIKTDRFHGDGREGGSLLYVIFFITLLSVFACGFMAVSRYHIKMALKNRAYMEARLTTHMIHNSFCEAVSKGEVMPLGFCGTSMKEIWRMRKQKKMKTKIYQKQKVPGQTG